MLTILLGLASLKSRTLRVLFDVQPTIVIKKGKIQRKALNSLKLNLDELLMLIRTKNVFNIKDIDYAILETNGELTILKEESMKQVTKKDMNIKMNKDNYINCAIILDGLLIKENLKESNIDYSWVIKELNKHGINDFKNVFYAEIQDDGKLFIDND